MIFDMKRLKTIEKDFVLRPNPYVTEEQSNKILAKLAIGEVLALSSFACIALTLGRIKPSITSAASFRNFTYFQGVSSLGLVMYHLHELDVLGKECIPENELNDKMKTYDKRYPS